MMEHEKILNSLNGASDSKFLTRKWDIVNDHSNANYDAGNKIIKRFQNLIFVITTMLTFQ